MPKGTVFRFTLPVKPVLALDKIAS
jgi:hypothetical protein